MKAWIVSDISDEWVSLFHAETQGKAKVAAMAEYGMEEFIDMRAKRFPKLDNKKFTYADCKEAGFEYLDDWHGTPIEAAYFISDCGCEICRKGE